MNGIEFYTNLRQVLVLHQPLSDNGAYTFRGWTDTGKLTYNVNNAARQPQLKNIPLEIVVMAWFWNNRGIQINHQHLVINGHNNFCTPTVLNYLLENYG